jgi:PAS domain S-box-containing protein
MILPNGRLMPFVHPDPTGQVPSVTDRQLRAVIDTIPGPVWLAGVDGGAECLNRRWLEYTGLSQTDAAGWGWTVAIHPDDLDRLGTYWRSVLQSGVRGQTEARLRLFDGEYRWFMFTGRTRT